MITGDELITSVSLKLEEYCLTMLKHLIKM